MIVSLAMLAIWLSGRVYFFLTDGFSVSNIRSELTYHSDWDSNNYLEVGTILNQDFNYLGKGCQFYTFMSQDGQYVLKFFKQKHLRDPIMVQIADFIGLKDYAAKQRERKFSKVDKLFKSCKLAYEYLPQETGVVAIHLNKTKDQFKDKTTIYDKMGFAHTIDLNDFEFVLQKAAQPVVGTKEAVASMCQVVEDRCRKGIADRDPAFIQNMGLLPDGRAIIIDIGQLEKDDRLKDEETMRIEIQKRLNTLSLERR